MYTSKKDKRIERRARTIMRLNRLQKACDEFKKAMEQKSGSK